MPGSGAGVYVARFGLDTFQRVVRTPPGKADRILSVSPDGSRLLLFRARAAHNPDAHGVLYTLSLLPHPRLVRLSSRHSYSWCCYYGAPASWAPDSSRVAFAAFVPGADRDTSRTAVFVAEARDGAVRRITRWGSWTTSARWSPGGLWILFDRANTAPNHDLLIVHPDGSKAHVIQTNSGQTGSCCGQWTPDGRYIVYEHGADDRQQALYVVNVAGRAEPRRLTSSDGPYFSFAVTG
jgi:Tol biopolymer transport system component